MDDILTPVLSLPTIEPMLLQRRADPFNDPQWLFELKYDGFRSLAYFKPEGCRLISRNGNTFQSFATLADELKRCVPVRSAILDGEIVCIGSDGRPRFYDLLYRKGTPLYFAFDLLSANGKDMRSLPLIERKAKLRSLLHDCTSPILYVQHVESEGEALFQCVREMDLEGIVAKHKYGPYASAREQSTWFKIRNRAYSQMVGRESVFERDRHAEPVPGWHTCDWVCEALSSSR